MTRILPRRNFRLSEFDLEPLAFELTAHLEEGELLLDRMISRNEQTPGVIALAAPTAGELHASIERHLQASERLSQPAAPDAREELREALAELRRSLG